MGLQFYWVYAAFTLIVPYIHFDGYIISGSIPSLNIAVYLNLLALSWLSSKYAQKA